MPKINLTDLSNLQNEVTATAAINNNNTLIEAAIDNSISRDGTQPNQMNSVLDMNSNKIINLPDALTDQEPVTYGQFLEGVSALENGAVIDADFVTLSNHDSITNERVLTAGPSLELIDGGAGSTIVIGVSSDELNALAGTGSEADKLPYYDGIGTAALADFTSFGRTLVDDTDATTARATLGSVIGTDVQAHDASLDTLASSGNGIMTKTATGVVEPRTVTGTANEIFVTNGDGVSGNPTVSLPSAITLTGKTVTGGTINYATMTIRDNALAIVDSADASKQLNFELSGITPSTSRVLTVPDASTTVVGTDTTQTLTNKTIDGTNNTINNVALSDLAAQAAYTFVGNNTGSSASPTAVDIAALTTKGTPASGDYVILSDQAASGAWKKATVNSIASAGSVTSIAGNTGAFTLANGIDNSTNQIQLTAARRTLPTVQTFTSGSGTYTTPANCLWIEVEMIGGGGGGAGSGTTPGNGGSGGNTTFGTALLVANGGAGTSGGAGGGLGGAASGGFLNKTGGQGGHGSGLANQWGGEGASSAYSGGGTPGQPNQAAGGSATANSGAGGGGGGCGATPNSGGGGGGGAFLRAIINSPSATYSYAVGAAGTAGTAGTSGVAGGAGGSGFIQVIEHYGS